MRAISAVLIAWCVVAAPRNSNAQTQQGSPTAAVDYKDPGTSTLLGVLVTGGGQMYSGETSKGLTLLGIGAGSLIAGEVMSASSCLSSSLNSSCNVAPVAIGSLVYVGTWLYGLMDAGAAARRHNEAAGVKTATLSPTIQLLRSGHREVPAVGLTLAF